ncbi:MAG: hypothetical protein AB1609_17485 [Bacillota bacterium]
MPELEQLAALWWCLGALPAGWGLQAVALLVLAALAQGFVGFVAGLVAGTGRFGALEGLVFKGAVLGVAVALGWPRLEPVVVRLAALAR